MMTNYNERLDEILRELDRGEYLGKGGVPGAKQAILNWHNKQIEGVLDRLSNTLTGSNDFRVEPSVKLRLSVGQIVSVRSVIEGERNKLKEMMHD